MSKVTNLNPATNHKCKCASWNDHLNKFGGAGQSIFCSEVSCFSLADVGAHVQIENNSTWYVIALCNSHNQLVGDFQIKDDAKRARANAAETCENKKSG